VTTEGDELVTIAEVARLVSVAVGAVQQVCRAGSYEFVPSGHSAQKP
jgi:hypothetical protein